MGFFFKNKRNREEKVLFYESGLKFNKNSWYEVFSASLGKVIASQNACSQYVVKNQDWNVDFSKGVISFGRDEYPLQFIGSEAKSSNTWLWGWENINGFKESIIATANKTKAIGEDWKLEPLTVDEFEITEAFNGHKLAIVTCALSRENMCYYRGPHDNGAVLVGFTGVDEKVFAPVGWNEFIKTTMECIESVDVDHKIFIESFLLQNKIPYEWDGNSLIAHFEQNLKIEFEQVEDVWRISNIETI